MRRPSASALTLLALAGCGGNEAAKEPPLTVAAGGTARVTAKEYSFNPRKVVLSQAGRVRIALANEGSLAHNLKVTRDGRQLGGTPTLSALRSGSGTVRLGSGSYRMVCTVGDHAELGMTGTLEVR